MRMELLSLDSMQSFGMIQHASAVIFAVRDMAPSIAFYGRLGFDLQYGGNHAAFIPSIRRAG